MCSNECSGESDDGKCFFELCGGNCAEGCQQKCHALCGSNICESCSGTKNKPILVKIPHIYISYSIEVLIYKHADKLKYFRQFND